MKQRALLAASLMLAACGGSKKQAAPPSPPIADPVEDDEPEPEPAEPAAPPPPMEWHAGADLVPVKGIKLKSSSVTLHQTEGEGVHVAAALEGLAAGTYHLVVHESSECGKDAAKAGKVLPAAAEIVLTLAVAKTKSGSLDQMVELELDGDDSIVGRTLVVHADKKGKPGKAVACGVIVAGSDDGDEGDDEE